MQAFVLLSVLVASVAASQLPLDTPEVAAAKAQHLAAVEEAKARAWAAPGWAARSAWASPALISAYYAPSWSSWSVPAVVNGQVQDTPEVAAEKAKHLSILASEHARHGSVLQLASPISYVASAAPVVVANGQVQDTPEVAQAKAQHLAAHIEARARAGIYAAEAPVVSAIGAPLISTAYAVPALQSQYHAQDGLGQYSYAYSGGPSSKAESKSIDGVTRGSFSYVDSNGLIQSRSYVADDNGFRVAASDLPVGPSQAVVAAPVQQVAVAAPVQQVAVAAAPVAVASDTPVVIDAEGHLADTVEVAAAKVAHHAAHQEARARLANAW